MAETWSRGDTVTNAEGDRLIFTGTEWVPPDHPEVGRIQFEQNPLEPTPLERAGRGVVDIGMGIPQALGLLSPETEAQQVEDKRLFERGAGSGIDVPRIAAQGAMLYPLARMMPGMAATGLVGRTLAGTAAGGLSGASLFTSEPGERATNVIGGAAGGGVGAAVLPPLAKGTAKTGAALLRGAGRLRRGMAKADDFLNVQLEDAAKRAGMSLDDLSEGARRGLQKEANKAFRAGDLDADALVRKARAEGFGFVDDAAPTRGQVTRDPRQFSDEVNLAKVQGAGDPLDSRFTAQRARVSGVLDETGERVGGFADETFDTAGEAIEEVAQKRAKDWQKTVKARYDAARESAPDTLLDGARLRDSVASVLKERRNAIPADVRRRISELSKDGIDPVELENLDKLITEYKGADPATNNALGKLTERVRALMTEAGEEFGGAYQEAVEEAFKRFSAIGDWKQMTGQLVRGTMDPEKVAPKVMTGSVRQIERLKKFVSDADPATWQRLSRSIWNKMVDDATPSGNFSQAAYNRILKRIGDRRLRLIFGDDADGIKAFGQVAEDLFAAPAGNRINTSNTTPTAANWLQSIVGGIADAALPGGRLMTPMLSAATSDAGEAVQRRLVADALSGVPGPVPLTALPPRLEGLLSRGALAAPVGGLLAAQPGR